MKQIILRGIICLATTAFAVGCGPTDEGPWGDCLGKCEGRAADRLVDLFKDPSSFEEGDLTMWATRLVTDELNSLLSDIPFFRPHLSKTEVYALEERAEHSFTIRSMRDLTAGLMQTVGEKDFSTHINNMRQQYLESNPRHVWAEARFRMPNHPNLSFSTPGYDGQDIGVAIGARFGFPFIDQDIEATVIAPYNADSTTDLGKALVSAPADAVLMALGGLPTSLDDFRRMTPGQLISLHSAKGVAGFTVGASTPVYIASVSEATIWARISAAANVSATAELDIQMIRDDNNKLIVDVGLTNHGDKDELDMQFRLATKGYWSVDAFSENIVDIGPVDVDVADLANDVVEHYLKRYAKPFKASIEYNPQVKTRHSITRFAFDLNATGAQAAKMEQALNLASRGVLWLAQALALQASSGVEELLSVERLARTPSFFAGMSFPVLGMNFHYEHRRNIGNASLTIGPNTQHLFWNQVKRSSGWFFTDEAYKVAGLASVTTNFGRPIAADHNLRITLVEKESNRTNRDQILDHLDPLLATFIGSEQMAALDAIAQKIEKRVNGACWQLRPDSSDQTDRQAEQQYADCKANAMIAANTSLEASQMKDAVADAITCGHLRGGMDNSFQTAGAIVNQLLSMKIAAHASDTDNSISGPDANMRIQYRLSAEALADILAAPDASSKFRTALEQTVFELNRNRWEDWKSERTKIVNKYDDEIDDVVKKFDKTVDAYLTQHNFGQSQFRTNTGQNLAVGDHGVVVLIDDRGQRIADSEEMPAISTIAERKVAAMTRLFEKLRKEAKAPPIPLIGRLFGGLGTTEHQILGYTFLRAAQPSQVELLVDMRFDDEPFAMLPELQLYGRGANVKLIDPGRFDLDTLIGN